MSAEPEVTVNENTNRFEMESDGGIAFIDFRLSGSSLTLTHTEVPPKTRRKGIGSALVQGALQYARKNSLTVIPLCPFVSAYMRRHKETLDLLDPAYAKG